jgi:predicted nucleotidyltransferase/DNA-binding transcriptional ArsR family regulator
MMLTDTSSVANFLLGNTRAAVLRTLLLQPGTALHVRELARVTGASPGSLHRDLRMLTELGLLLREEVGHQVHYRANSACPAFEALTGLLRDADVAMPAPQAHTPDARVLHSPVAAYRVPQRGKLHIPRGPLAALCRKHHIRKLSLFGSAARNEMSPTSDIDLLVEFESGSGMSLLDMPALQEELSALFGRKVDVATPEILDNPFRRKAILPELKTLYGA